MSGGGGNWNPGNSNIWNNASGGGALAAPFMALANMDRNAHDSPYYGKSTSPGGDNTPTRNNPNDPGNPGSVNNPTNIKNQQDLLQQQQQQQQQQAINQGQMTTNQNEFDQENTLENGLRNAYLQKKRTQLNPVGQ